MKEEKNIRTFLCRSRNIFRKKPFCISAIVLLFLLTAGILFITNKPKLKDTSKKTAETNTDKEEISGEALTITMQYPNESHPNESYDVFSEMGKVYQSPNVTEQGGTLHIEAKDRDIKEVCLYMEGPDSQLHQETLALENGKQDFQLAQFGMGTYQLSLRIQKGGKYSYYVSSLTGFSAILQEEMLENAQLYLLQDINVLGQDFLIQKPFAFHTNGHRFITDSKLLFASETEGTMIIKNTAPTDIEVSQTWADTPHWSYKIEHLFSSFEEEQFCCIRAEKINEREIDRTRLCINSQEKLQKYVENNAIAIPGEVAVLELKEEVDISSEEGSIQFDIPGVALVWNGTHAVSEKYAQQYMNLLSYNGKNMNSDIGGFGKSKILSGQMADGNGTRAEMHLDGNYIRISTGFLNSLNLETMQPDVKLSSEGSCRLVQKKDNYYLQTTDSEGKTRGYRLYIDSAEYDLPIIRISTVNNAAITSTDTYIDGSFSIEYSKHEPYENIQNAGMKIRGRGQSSWKLPKKPYKIKFTEKTSLFGLTAAKKWLLLANHTDRTLIRNILAMSMGRVLDNMLFVPHAYPVNVFINNEYVGVYSLSEQIEVNEGRIPGEEKGTAIDTDYLMEFGGDVEKTSFGTNSFSTSTQDDIVIREPSAKRLSRDQYQYLASYVTETENAIASLSGYEEYIDIPSLIDWFILNEFSYNLDGSLRRSNFFLKKKGDKLYYASPWDFDYAFGNFWRDSSEYKEWICLGNANTDNYITTNWMTYLLKDPAFKAQLKARWNEVGEKLYHTAMNTIEANEKLTASSAQENFKVWNNCFGRKIQYENSRTASISTYEGHMEYLRKFIKNRYNWMDQTIQGM